VRTLSFRILFLGCSLACATNEAVAIGPYDARNGDECRAQVMANFNALAAESSAAGNPRAITSHWNRWAVPELEACERMDQAVRDERMRAAHERLMAAIATLKDEGVVRDEETRWLQREKEAIAGFPHAPYRDAVLALHADFLRYAAAPPPSGDACDGIRRAMKSARAEHDRAVDALLARTEPWRLHEQVRQAALSEWQFQRHLAKRAACATR
jgi:hypothetical protein